ncbi:hypothetical protein RI367_001937 [Sorochytrium milnesiophthora]
MTRQPDTAHRPDAMEIHVYPRHKPALYRLRWSGIPLPRSVVHKKVVTSLPTKYPRRRTTGGEALTGFVPSSDAIRDEWLDKASLMRRYPHWSDIADKTLAKHAPVDSPQTFVPVPVHVSDEIIVRRQLDQTKLLQNARFLSETPAPKQRLQENGKHHAAAADLMSMAELRSELDKEKQCRINIDPAALAQAPPLRRFVYITDLLYPPGIPRPDPGFLEGCACGRPSRDNSGFSCCDPRSSRFFADAMDGEDVCACGQAHQHMFLSAISNGNDTTVQQEVPPFPYRINIGKNGEPRSELVVPPGHQIRECNVNCACTAKTCFNRVVQRGMTIPRLTLSYTAAKQWHVKCESNIPEGTFVCQYLGQVISVADAQELEKQYSKHTACTYIFDLDFARGDQFAGVEGKLEAEYSIDGTRWGNISRFINHSCDPNCAIYAVQYDSADPLLHRLAFFTRRDIIAGEELTFDYEGKVDYEEAYGKNGRNKKKKEKPVSSKFGFQCLCGSSRCRRWIL